MEDEFALMLWWYWDSSEDEIMMMLGPRAFGRLGFPLEYHQLPQDLQDKLQRLYELW